MSSHTIHEIARISGVSSATVSRVLNGATMVSSSTRERVLAVISDLNYQPNEHAIELVRSRRQRNNQRRDEVAPYEHPSISGPEQSPKVELESLRQENSRLRSVVADLSLKIAQQRGQTG